MRNASLLPKLVLNLDFSKGVTFHRLPNHDSLLHIIWLSLTAMRAWKLPSLQSLERCLWYRLLDRLRVHVEQLEYLLQLV